MNAARLSGFRDCFGIYAASRRSRAGAGLAGALVLLLAGCRTVGPDFEPQTVPADAPAAFRHAPSEAEHAAAPTAVSPSWEAFGDPTLVRLIEAAFAFDPSLEAAEAHLAEARALLGVVESASRLAAQFDGAARLAGETAEQPPVPPYVPARRERGDRWQASVSVGYELDLWGRLRRSREAGAARADAAAADLATARQLLAAEVARAWFSLEGLRTDRALLDETLANRLDSLALREADFAAGRRPENDLQQARVEFAALEADRAALDADLARAGLALARLCGPGSDPDVKAETNATADRAIAPPPRWIVDRPAAVLLRRPDVAAAEATWHAAVAEIGVATAERYPDLRLGASAGLDSLALGDLLERPAQFWNLGPSLNLPVFTGGRLDAQVAAAEARAQAAAAAYRTTMLNAVQAVESDLASLRHLDRQEAALDRAAAGAEDLVALARSRYDAGLAAYFEVVEAERNRLALERSRRAVRTQRLLATASLLRQLAA
jgi:multidrug efflux system outer membrane protein